MSMSADASCQGLQSPTVGTSTLALERFPTPVMQCRFPEVFEYRKVWRDLSGSTQIVVDDQMQVIRIRDASQSYSLNSDESGSQEVKLVMRCRTSHGTGGIQKYVVHTTTSECESNYRCLLIKKRDSEGKVLEMELGQPFNDEFTACDDRTFTTGDKRILIGDDVKPTNCPVQAAGSFGFTDKTSDCKGQFIIGCSSPQEIVIQKKCPINLESVNIWRCLSDWKEGNNTHYVMVQSPKLLKPAMCLSFTITDNGIEVQEDEYCMRKATVSRSSINYLLFRPKENCNPNTHSSITETPSDMTSDRTKTSPNKTGVDRIQGSEGVINADNASSRISVLPCVVLLISFVTMLCFGR